MDDACICIMLHTCVMYCWCQKCWFYKLLISQARGATLQMVLNSLGFQSGRICKESNATISDSVGVQSNSSVSQKESGTDPAAHVMNRRLQNALPFQETTISVNTRKATWIWKKNYNPTGPKPRVILNFETLVNCKLWGFPSFSKHNVLSWETRSY